ncbi:MAG: ComEC/Rec2 family competence protein [Anaerolineae bacterium]|nr:ComEC/Rec2 family competence protein [Anaerolineae bacterium]MDW7992134.1 ComEC/Rec2 family competence protein [Anaerolineae bacterium]
MTLVYLAIAWLTGIALGKAAHPPWQVLLLLGLAAVVGWVGWRDYSLIRSACVLLLIAVLGAGRLLWALPRFPPNALAHYNDVGPVLIEGTVTAAPDERDTHTRLRLRAERLILPDGQRLSVRGTALVYLPRYPTFSYGDRLLVGGLLETPPEFADFSYREYLARQGVFSLVRRAQAIRVGRGEVNPLQALLLALRQRAREVIGRILHEPAASLLTGILLGVEGGIPKDVRNAFAATGTAHIIAISGFNIAIISGLFFQLFRRWLGPQRAVWPSIVGVALYTLLVGASASVVRAAIMGILYLLGRHLGRPTYVPASLAAAAVGMTLLNPFVLWDVGFQLSFAATLGLVLYVDRLEGMVFRFLTRTFSEERARQAMGFLTDALLVTLAAQIATLPLTLYYFRRLSLVSLLANFLILPAQPGVMVWGGLATLAGLLWLPLGQVLGWVAWLFLTYTIGIVQWAAGIPYAWVDVGRMTAAGTWALYGLIGALTAWADPRIRARLRGLWTSLTGRVSDRFLLSAAALLLLLAVAARLSMPDGRLHVAFLDVTGGDAIFIRTPSGRQVLVGGAPGTTELLSALGRRMPFWDHELEVVVLTRPSEDVLSGLIAVLERYPVHHLIARDEGCAGALCGHWREVAARAARQIWRGERGLQMTLDEGLLLTVLYPGPSAPAVPSPNVVVRLDYGSVCVLLTGNLRKTEQEALVEAEAWLECDVLKAPHYEGMAGLTGRFLNRVNPEVVVVPAGDLSPLGRPSEDGHLEARAVYKIAERGTVEIISDGKGYRIETER